MEDLEAGTFKIFTQQLENDVKATIIYMRKVASRDRELYWAELEPRDQKNAPMSYRLPRAPKMCAAEKAVPGWLVLGPRHPPPLPMHSEARQTPAHFPLWSGHL